MVPKHGGTPLPLSPICLPREHGKAEAFVAEIQAALERPGWSGSQRRRLRELYRLWLFRAEGRDPQFEAYGSFHRPPGTAPPTATDVIVAKWRRLAPHDADTRRRRRVPYRVRDLSRERDRYGD